MPFTLQQLSDLEDIRIMKHRYFRGIDTADVALLTPLMTEDITVEYRGGTYTAKLQGREAMIDFILNSFNADAIAMHHGHMPEITFTGDDTAEGVWYLQDIFISLERVDYTIGTAIYRDRYRRVDGEWKMSHTEYDRVMEMIEPLRPEIQISNHFLAKVGRKREDCGDISHLIDWHGGELAKA